jgi:hypothetical protein
MLNFKKILMIMGIASMSVLAACGATTNADGDATDGTGSDATVGNDTAGTDQDTMAMPTYKSIVIWDKSADPSFINGKCGSSPGADIDAVGLYRGGKLIAVGATGTAKYVTSSASTCDNKKNLQASAEGPLNGHVFASNPDTGYISLNGGSIELQFAACKTGTTISDCDGAGALVDVMSGDEIDVWEVDGSYKAGSKTPADGNAYDGCVCYSDEYQLDARPTVGVDTGSVALPKAGDGNSADKKWYAGSTTVKVP